jgi:hypothetical protein
MDFTNPSAHGVPPCTDYVDRFHPIQKLFLDALTKTIYINGKDLILLPGIDREVVGEFIKQ